MKVFGPRIKQAPAAEAKKESGPVGFDVRGGNRKDASGKVSRTGDAHSDNLQSARKPRDVFQSAPSGGGTRAGNLRLGESHADNISKGPRDGHAAPPTVEAGSIHTLLNRLFPKPQKPGTTPSLPEGARSNIGTQGSRIRPGDGHGDLVTLGDGNGGGGIFDRGTNTGIVPPGTPGSTTPVTATGSTFKKALLSKQALEDLKSPELTPRLVRKLSKATNLQKVDKLTRFLSDGLRGTIMLMAQRTDDSRYGGSNSDNLQA